MLPDGFSVPQDTRPHFSNRSDIENLALYLQKAVRFSQNGGEWKAELPKGFPAAALNALENIQDAYQTSYAALIRDQPGVQMTTIKRGVDWRLAIGLGQASVYENDITLHHVYGVPYLPGSGIKGAVRSFVLRTAFLPADTPADEMTGAFSQQLEAEALQDPLFSVIFGAPPDTYFENGRRGSVVFFDAFPAERPTVERDVMTPHYGDYYAGKKSAPTDDQKTNPIFFPTVRDTAFTFHLGVFPDAPSLSASEFQASPMLAAAPDAPSASLLDLAGYWLQRTLTEHGLGAKTAVGYGFFGESSSTDE
jgi:CRISPR-associated protein Cmr6